MKTVIIFGGSGFIGQNIVRSIAKIGYNIVIPYQKEVNEEKLRLYGNSGQIIPLKFKGLEDIKIQNAIKNANVVINLKTIWQENRLYSYEKHILKFNIQLVDLIKSLNKKIFLIFFSGLGVSEKSLSNRIKYIAKSETYIQQNLKDSTIIRPSLVIGKSDQFLKKLLPIFKLSYIIPIFGSGLNKLQPVFIDDVILAINKIIVRNQTKDIFELAGPEIFTYKKFYQFIAECLGLKRIFISIPFALLEFSVSILERTPLNIITKDQLLLFKVDNIVSKSHKNFKELDIIPRNIRDIIKKII